MCRINGLKLEMIRKSANMSQKALAKELGVAASTINNYESGKSNPSDEVVDKLCMILKVHKDEVEIHDVGYSFLDNRSKHATSIRNRRGFIRVMTPEETEAWINSKRVVAVADETRILNTKLKNAMGIGPKKYILIDPRIIHIPDWQRDTDMIKSTEIAENYSEVKYDPIKIYIDKTGKANAADGAHRTVAKITYAERNNCVGEEILVEVLDCDEHGAILAFLGQGIGRKTMSTSDTYRAGIKANIEEYVKFKDFFEKRNVQITMDNHKLENPIGYIKPSVEIMRMVVRDEETTSNIVSLMIKLGWTGSDKEVFIRRNFLTLKKLYAHYGKETVELKLMKYCKGATYYESIIYPIKSDSEVYDLLERKMSR